MPNTYKLTYFNLTGHGETIRLIFAAAGVPFQDNRIDFAAWGPLKPSEFEVFIIYLLLVIMRRFGRDFSSLKMNTNKLTNAKGIQS
jgi:hypothetical protein